MGAKPPKGAQVTVRNQEEIRQVVPKGTVIFREGEPGDCAYVIERGTVEISMRNGAENIVIARRGSGEIFGEMAVVDNRPRSATVTAASDCELLMLSGKQLHERMESLDPVLRMVLTVILDRFRDTLQRFKSENSGNIASFIATSGGDADVQLQAHREAIERIELEQSLSKAVAREELLLFFQPIVCGKTGRIESFEALVRWQHPNHGLIPPGAFIEAAEQSGLITEISRYVLEKACQALANLRAVGEQSHCNTEQLGMSVNVTAREFADESFVDYVVTRLEKHSVDPKTLSLEITESTLMENTNTTRELLERLRDIGVSISIDDFGTGYSSLSHLHQFPVETLKIDRSFVAELGLDESGKELVRTMITLGHGLGLKIVAEGIEEPEQAAALQLFGCDLFQGYMISKPMPFLDVLSFVREWQGFDEDSFETTEVVRGRFSSALG